MDVQVIQINHFSYITKREQVSAIGKQGDTMYSIGYAPNFHCWETRVQVNVTEFLSYIQVSLKKAFFKDINTGSVGDFTDLLSRWKYFTFSALVPPKHITDDILCKNEENTALTVYIKQQITTYLQNKYDDPELKELLYTASFN